MLIQKNFKHFHILDPACKWGHWQDNDDSSGKGDFEKPPEDCIVEGYQIQMGDGMTYTNVSDITFQILHDHPYIYCLNSENG